MAAWQHAVVAMTWIGVVVGSIEILLILALLLYACVSHGTCRPSQVFAVALERCEEHEEDSDLLPRLADEACRENRTSWSMHVDALLRRLAKEEASARRLGRARHANFIAALGQRLELQLRDTAVARSRHHAEEQQLRAEERQLQVLLTTMPDSLPRASLMTGALSRDLLRWTSRGQPGESHRAAGDLLCRAPHRPGKLESAPRSPQTHSAARAARRRALQVAVWPFAGRGRRPRSARLTSHNINNQARRFHGEHAAGAQWQFSR